MALRIIDIYRRTDAAPLELPDDTYDILDHWSYELEEGQRTDRVLLDVEDTESFLDWVDRSIPSECRVVIQSVEATLPHPEVSEDEDEAVEGEDVSVGRVSRTELYEYARTSSNVSTTFFSLVFLSTIVAAGGMLREQVAVVIGAMMIAPLLGPNISLALGTTLGDSHLLRQSLLANITGVTLAFGVSLIIGVFFTVDPTSSEIVLRTVTGFADMVLAVSAGAAGALSVTRDKATGFVGVMVAVALLPPVVATGLLLGDGHRIAAAGAGLHTITNVVSVNVAAVGTFLILGVEPRKWTAVEQARTSTRIALILWTAVLVILILVVWLSS